MQIHLVDMFLFGKESERKREKKGIYMRCAYILHIYIYTNKYLNLRVYFQGLISMDRMKCECIELGTIKEPFF